MGNIVKHKNTGLQQKNIVISNVLVRSAQGLTLVEKRILMAALGQMGGIFKPIKLSAIEYAQTYNLDLKNAYNQLKDASKNFRSRYVTYAEEDREGHRMNWEVNWLSAIGYEDNQGYIQLEFNPKLFPHLCELQSQFTKYQLKQTAALRSVYSWRLLELIEQMKDNRTNTGWLSINLEAFLIAMDASSSYYKNFSLVRNKIIIPAVTELSEKDSWKIKWEAVKTGRKVTQLKFKFERPAHNQGSLF